jgi:hypothetical protein
MPLPPVAETRASETLRGLDDMLRTRPLLWTVFAGHGMRTRDRWTVSTYTLGAVLRYRWGRATWAFRETLGAWWTRSIRRRRPSLRGLRPVEGLEGSGWWRAVEPGAAHRCRIAFGRLRGPSGRASMTLFAGIVRNQVTCRSTPSWTPSWTMTGGSTRWHSMMAKVGCHLASVSLHRPVRRRSKRWWRCHPTWEAVSRT